MIHRYSKRSDDVFVLRARRRVMLFVVLVVLVLASVVTSLALGQYYVPLRDLLTILTQPDSSSLMHNVIWEIRLPRIVLGLLVGACLGVAGTLMQAVLRIRLRSRRLSELLLEPVWVQQR